MEQARSRPVILGVTGGVASGKSTVVGFLVDCGARRVSADEIARDLLSPGSEMTAKVLAHFGPNFAQSASSASIDRRKLAKHIFTDERARRELGELMHPVIRRIMTERIGQALAEPNCRLVAAEIPLLYENRLRESVDYVLVAVCAEQQQAERLLARSEGLAEVDALRQIRSQMPLIEKARLADFTIDTSGTLAEVRRAASELYEKLTER